MSGFLLKSSHLVRWLRSTALAGVSRPGLRPPGLEAEAPRISLLSSPRSCSSPICTELARQFQRTLMRLNLNILKVRGVRMAVERHGAMSSFVVTVHFCQPPLCWCTPSTLLRSSRRCWRWPVKKNLPPPAGVMVHFCHAPTSSWRPTLSLRSSSLRPEWLFTNHWPAPASSRSHACQSSLRPAARLGVPLLSESVLPRCETM